MTREEVRAIVDSCTDDFEAHVSKRIAIFAAENKETAARLQADIDKRLKDINIPTVITIDHGGEDTPIPPTYTAHYRMPTLMKYIKSNAQPFITGPAGSGKSYACKQVAEILDRPFYYEGALDDKYAVTGYLTPDGKYVESKFFKAFKNGGIFLFDEMDGSDPEVLVAMNNLLAVPDGGLGSFPCGMVPRHKDLTIVVAANTSGRGATRQYVGRSQLDAATMDRFRTFSFPYDPALETTFTSNKSWLATVHATREAVDFLNMDVIVSPRAIIAGTALLAAGVELDEVLESCIYKGLDADAITKIEQRVNAEAK